MFFPPNCPPEVLQKVVEMQSKQNLEKAKKKSLSNEEREEIKKMNEYKKLIDNFHKDFNYSKGFSMSGMMYYGNIFGEYHRLKNKYSDKEKYGIHL